MGNKVKFAGINTKIRAMGSKLLDDEEYISLINMNNVDDQVVYLKNNTDYSKVLEGIKDTGNLKLAEKRIKSHIIVKINKIIKYFSDKYEEFFRMILLRHEIEDLKICLRAVIRHENVEIEMDLIGSEYSRLDYKSLLMSSNIREFVDSLKKTIYYEALLPYVDEDVGKLLFYTELSLDKLYFRKLWETGGQLSSIDRNIFEGILGENIDLINIEWIYRGIRFYKLLPEEMINYTLPYGSIFDYKKLKQMCYSDLNQLSMLIKDSKYGILYKDDGLYMNTWMHRYLHHKFKSLIRNGKLDLNTPIAYMHLLEFEAMDIVSIMESKRYGLSLNDTIKYLIRNLRGSDIDDR